jgi:hypothetical protein
LPALIIHAGIRDDPVKPRCEFRFAAKLADAGEQLEKDLLGDVASCRLIAAEMQGYRVDAILVNEKQLVEGIPIAALTRLDDLGFWPAIAHLVR